MLSGGHAANALPQMARANVNCRIFPGEDPAEVRKTLERVAADPKVTVAMVPQIGVDGRPVPTSPCRHRRCSPKSPTPWKKRLSQTCSGNIPVVATMSTGATDGRITRSAGIPTFGISCMFYQ